MGYLGFAMLDGQSSLKGQTIPGSEEASFIQGVHLKPRRRRGGVDGLLLGFWVLLLVKCLLSTWAVAHWDMPVSSFWVWLPSMIFGAVCTSLYCNRQ